MSRLAKGGRIDREKPLSFEFDGKPYSGFAGDTLASALLANDVHLVGRSFKYHRPRGILSAGSEEPNALVTLGQGAHVLPNTKATTVPLTQGLVATSQNRWPSLRFDLMSINQLFAPILVAGFYYKTFMWPAAFWEKLYEPLIRRAAGLGALSGIPDPDRYGRMHAFCDLLVIGAGPAGLAAALAAGRRGVDVIVTNEAPEFGGRLLSERHQIAGLDAEHWRAQTLQELHSLNNVRLLPQTAVFGIFDGNEYAAVETPLAPGIRIRQRYWKIIARHSVLATGALERPLVFGNNDRPGVMLASAVQSYVNRYGVAPGRRVVIYTSTDSGWALAQDLLAAGVTVVAVVEARDKSAIAPPLAATAAACLLYDNARVLDAQGSPVRRITVRDKSGRTVRINCDLLAVSGGWDPAIGLASHLGDRPAWSESLQSFLIARPPPGLTAVGAAAGHLSLQEALIDGLARGDAVAESLGRPGANSPVPRADEDPTGATALWSIPEHKGKAFVDFQHDVTDADIKLAAREGYTSVEHMKRYTTAGMATDQGRSGQLNAQAILAGETGRAVGTVGTILSRPPFVPVSIALLAGHHRQEHYRPVRQTVTHDWAAARGSSFVDAGHWKRAQWFPQPGETDWLQSVNREVRATRDGVGVCDVSTLGKIDVLGPDAGTLLDRLYVNTMSSLPVGRVRYGLMLREDGIAFDDGTVTRLAVDHFYLTTTTANAGKVMQHIDFARQVIWPQLDVQAASVTEEWATFAVAGPRSRELLQHLLPEVDLSNQGLPYMHMAQVRWRGVRARLFRVSFSGELAYEISVSSRSGLALFLALMEAGVPYGVVPYGTEALTVMRIEKGHPAGNELNGQTTAGDLNLGRLLSPTKDFIGRSMAARPGLTDPDRPRLVGLRSVQGAAIRAGAHILPRGAEPTVGNDQGWVSSAAYSPTLDCQVALAFVARAAERLGEIIVVHDPVRGPDVAATLCAPVFVDPQGARLRA
jgi:sarcosine oxidase subunit alpha